MEEIGFVPSAVSESREAAHWCDNQCSERGFRFNQIGAMVTEEGGEAHTINCKRCYNERLARQDKQPEKAAEWRDCRAKSFPWQNMEGLWNWTFYARNVGILH